MSPWTVYWIVMTVMVAGADIIAARNKTTGDTLSEHVWRLMSWRVFRILLVWGLSWGVLHLLTEGWI